MADIRAPVPDPRIAPKPAADMAAEGEREGAVQPSPTQPDEVEIERDPQFATNGE